MRLHNHGYWLLFGFQRDDTATAPNGEIYMPADLFAADFSTMRTRRQRLLVHEMTHVWQYRLGYPVKGVRAPRPNMSYEYTLDADRMFCDYNMEAQANLVADYFLLAFRSDPDALYERTYRSATTALPLYERTLRDEADRGFWARLRWWCRLRSRSTSIDRSANGRRVRTAASAACRCSRSSCCAARCRCCSRCWRSHRLCSVTRNCRRRARGGGCWSAWRLAAFSSSAVPR